MQKETRELILGKIDELTHDIAIGTKMVEKEQFAEYNELESSMLKFNIKLLKKLIIDDDSEGFYKIIDQL